MYVPYFQKVNNLVEKQDKLTWKSESNAKHINSYIEWDHKNIMLN